MSTTRTNEIERVTLDSRTIIGLRRRVSLDELSGFFADAIPVVAGALARAGTHPAGPPVAVYRHERGRHFDVTVGFPVPEAPDSLNGLVREVLPAGPAVSVVHLGSYDTLPRAYAELGTWFARRGLRPSELMWEEYLAGPGSVDDSEFRTRIVYPLS